MNLLKFQEMFFFWLVHDYQAECRKYFTFVIIIIISNKHPDGNNEQYNYFQFKNYHI